MPVSYVLLAVGNNELIHNQACYAIVSLLAYTEKENEILVVTDKPSHYLWLGKSVYCIPVNDEKLKQWKGTTGYFFRIKIKALQYAFTQVNNNHLVYLDSDIVCIRPLKTFEQQLDNGNFFMHEKEFVLSSGPTKTARQMWKVGKNKHFGHYLVNKSSVMWNSGIIAIPQANAHYLEGALEACDAMCQSGMRPQFTEQFAIGLALNSTNRLQEAKYWFLHYWGNKQEWQETVIIPFLQKIATHAYSLETAITLIRDRSQYPLTMRQKPPSFFRKIKSLIKK